MKFYPGLMILSVLAMHYQPHDASGQDSTVGTTTTTANGCARLTSSNAQTAQAGAYWSSTQRDLTQPFDLTYETFFGCDNGEWGGDGMAFVMHQDPRGVSAIGAGYGFLGYAGNVSERITPSLIVEFDTFDGTPFGGNDPAYDHVAIMRNGDQNDNYVGPVSVSGGELEDCGLWINDYFTIRITWDPGSQTLNVYTNGSLTTSLTEDIVTNYFGGNPNVWWGWTGATGTASNEQWVCPENAIIPWECFSNSCCNDVDLTFTGDTTICAGETKTIGLVGTYDSYEWSTGETTATIDVTTPGTYIVYVNEIQGTFACPGSDTIVITQVADPTITLVDETICNGDDHLLNAGIQTSYLWSDGSTVPTLSINTAGNYAVTVTNDEGCSASDDMNLTVNSPGPVNFSDQAICDGQNITLDAGSANDYNWSTGESTQQVTLSNAGTYHVTISDADGCTDRDTMELTINALPTVTLNDAQICPEDNITLDAGVGFDYLWSNGSNAPTFTVSNPANYHVTITDGNGCTDRDTMTLSNFLVSPVVLVDAEICSGALHLLDAGTAQTYLWSDGSTDQTTNISDAGAHHVTITDANGCTDRDTMNLMVNALPTVTLNDVSVCDGEIVLLDAGNGLTSYLWSDGSTDQTLSVSTSGTHHVTVTDDESCSNRDTMTLTLNPLPAINLNDANVCAGTNITLDAPAGMTSYVWSTGASTQNIVVNANGNYHVTVTDGNGCVNRDTMTYTEITNPNVVLNDANTCDEITLDAGNGFSYEWSTGASTQTIVATTSGTYHVTITAGTGCDDRDTMNLVVFPSPSITLTDESICPESSITLDAGAGFDYLWSNGSTDQTLTANTAGDYHVTITDGNGCTDRDSMQLTLFTVANLLLNDVSICEDQTETFDAGAAQSYLWSDGSTNQLFTTGIQGEYHVTTTDINGCTDRDTLFLTVNELPSIDLQDDEICEENSIELDAGPDMTSYLWSDGSTGQTLSVATQGLHHVTITDTNGCTNRDTMTLTVHDLPPIILLDQSICAGEQITLSAPAGMDTYIWSDGSSNVSIDVDVQGSYHATITDSNDCSNRDTMNLTVNPLPVVSLQNDTICVGESTNLDAGIAATYNWSNGATTQSIDISIDGAYHVTITDGNGCTDRDTMELSRRSAPVGLVQAVNCNGTGSAYTVDLFVTLGQPGTYTINGNPIGGSSYTSVPILSGNSYEFIVDDQFGCTPDTVTGVHICDCITAIGSMSPTPIELCDGETATAAYDDLHTLDDNDVFMYVLHTNAGNQLGQVIQTASSAQGPAFERIDGMLTETTYYISAIAGNNDGQGEVNFTDPCLQVAPGTPVLFHATPTAIVSGNAAFCSGDSAEVNVNFTGNQPFMFDLSVDGITEPTASTALDNISWYRKSGGTYSLRNFKDQYCAGIVLDSATLTVYNLPVLTASATPGEICPGDSSELTVNGASTYEWWPTGGLRDSAAQQIWAHPSSSTTYFVAGTDANGCTDTSAVSVSVLPDVQLTATPATICEGDTAQINATGADNYTWSPQDLLTETSNSQVLAFPATTSIITVIGESLNGCTDTTDITVTVLPRPSVAVTNHVMCSGDTVVIEPTGANTYAFNGSDSYTANGDAALFFPTESDSIRVIGTDTEGCSDTAFASVVVNEPPTIDNLLTTCNGTNTNYTVTFEVNGGDFSSLMVTGNTGTFDGQNFVSNPITEGAPFDFQVDDSNGCGPAIASGSKKCDCTTDAGTFTLTDTLKVCGTELASAVHADNETLDANDTLLFVLHTNSLATIGTVIAMNETADFAFDASTMQYNTYYFLSAVAGDALGDSIDFQDGCLSVTPGIPVVYRRTPTATLTSPLPVCEGETNVITLNFTGGSPWSFDWVQDGAVIESITTLSNEYTVNVSTAGVYGIESLQNLYCDGPSPSTVNVVFDPLPNALLAVSDPLLCLGDAAVLSISDSEIGVKYQFSEVGTGIVLGSELVGNGGQVSTNLITAKSSAFIAQATNTTTGCSIYLEDTAHVTISPPVNDAVLSDLTTCFEAGQDTVLVLSNTTQDILYELREAATNTAIGSSQTSTGTDLYFTIPSDLSATYIAIATDSLGCSAAVPDNGIIDVAPEITSMNSVINTSCSNICDGEISVDPADDLGSPSVSLTDMNFNAISPTIDEQYDNLCAGDYLSEISIEFMGLNCTLQDTLTVGAPLKLAITVDQVSVVSCHDGNDGAINTSVSGGTAPYRYLWSSGATSDDISGIGTGGYSITATDESDCAVDTALFIAEPDAIELTIAAPSVLCIGEEASITAATSGGTAPRTVWWSNSSSGDTFTSKFTQDSILTVYAEDVNGCASSVEVISVRVYSELAASMTDEVVACEGENINLTPTVEGGKPQYSYAWSNGASTSAISVGSSGDFAVSISDACGASIRLPAMIQIAPNPTTDISIIQDTICQGMVFGLSHMGMTDQCRWSITDFSGAVIFGNNDCVTEAALYTPGNYDLTFSATLGACQTDTIIEISVPKQQGVNADFSYFPSEPDLINSTVSFTNLSSNAIDYRWTFEGIDTTDVTDPMVEFPSDNSGYYDIQLVSTSAYGCIDSITQEIFIKDAITFYIPNSFTPDRDGINETFGPMMVGSQTLDQFEFYIYNRWGDLIFESYGANQWWDGTFKSTGEIVKSDVFTWQINFRRRGHSDFTTATGKVTVIR